MDKIFAALRQWIEALLARNCANDDPLAHLTTHEWADLPAFHPAREECPG